MTLIRNRGVSGDVLNGTNNGLVQVEGPAVWVPAGIVGNVLSASTSFLPAATTSIVQQWSGIHVIPPAFATIFGGLGGNAGFRIGMGLPGRAILTWGDGVAYYSATSTFDPVVGEWYEHRMTLTNVAGTANITHEVRQEIDGPWTEVYATTQTWHDAAAGVTGLRIGGNGGSVEQPNTSLDSVSIVVDGEVWLDWSADDSVTSSEQLLLAPSVGPSLLVERSATGPVTTLVPAGKTVLINPEEDAGNVVTVPELRFNVAADEDAVVIWHGRTGNETAGTGFPVRTSSFYPGSILMQMSSGALLGYVADDADNVKYNDVGWASEYEPIVYTMILDRSSDTFQMRAWSSDGILIDETRDATSIGALVSTTQGLVNSQMAGVLSAVSARHGVGIAAEYDDTTLAALAAYLLENV